jgi:hypothetical protein
MSGERPRLALSTRTAVEASRGALIDRLLALQERTGETASRRPAGPARRSLVDPSPPAPTAADSTRLPTAPFRAAVRDQVCLAAQTYARTLVREGFAPAAAVAAVRATVHEAGVAFLSADRLAALERVVVRAARVVC